MYETEDAKIQREQVEAEIKFQKPFIELVVFLCVRVALFPIGASYLLFWWSPDLFWSLRELAMQLDILKDLAPVILYTLLGSTVILYLWKPLIVWGAFLLLAVGSVILSWIYMYVVRISMYSSLRHAGSGKTAYSSLIGARGSVIKSLGTAYLIGFTPSSAVASCTKP